MNQWDQLTSGHKLDWDPKPNQDPKPAQTGTQNQTRTQNQLRLGPKTSSDQETLQETFKAKNHQMQHILTPDWRKSSSGVWMMNKISVMFLSPGFSCKYVFHIWPLKYINHFRCCFFLTTSMIHQLLHPSSSTPHPPASVCRMEDNKPVRVWIWAWRSRMNDGNESAALSSCRFTFSLLPSDLRQTTSLIVPDRSTAQPSRTGPDRVGQAGPCGPFD